MKINKKEAIDYIIDDIMTDRHGKTWEKQDVHLSGAPYTIRQVVDSFIDFLKMKKKEG